MIARAPEPALRAVVCPGASPGRPPTTRAIAGRTCVSPDSLSKALQGLSRAGMVESRRGLGGGSVLSRPRDELTVLDVINAVDPLGRIERCPPGLAAHRKPPCPPHRRPDEGIAPVEALFGGTTIAGLPAQAGPDRPLRDEALKA